MPSARRSLNLIILAPCARETRDNYLAVCRLCGDVNDKPVCLLKDFRQQRRQISSRLGRGSGSALAACCFPARRAPARQRRDGAR